MIKPLNFYVAVKPIETKEVKTASGITLVSNKSNNIPTGKIVAVYSSSYSEIRVDDVKVGDVIAYKTGIEVKDGDEVYTLVNEKDMIAILSEVE